MLKQTSDLARNHPNKKKLRNLILSEESYLLRFVIGGSRATNQLTLEKQFIYVIRKRWMPMTTVVAIESRH